MTGFTRLIEYLQKAFLQFFYSIGFTLSNEYCISFRDEDELLNKVVGSVLKNIPKTPLYVAQYPTGLEDKLQDP